VNQRTYERERLLLYCQEALADAIQRSGLKRSEIAARLGKNRTFVTQALSSGRNLTLASLADIAWAAGFRIEPQLCSCATVDQSSSVYALQVVAQGSYEPIDGQSIEAHWEGGAAKANSAAA
jgi:DNA-binding phage protein